MTPEPPSAPKYIVWANQIRNDIDSGVFKPGDCLPSLSQIKSEYGLSRSTAEKAYLLLEREGIVERRNGSGVYVTLPMAPETGIIGIVGGDIAERPRTPFWSHLLDGLQHAAIEADKRLLLLTADSPLGWNRVEGVIFASCSVENKGHQCPPGVPRVALLCPSPQVVSVMADEYEGGRLAAEHLLSLGHRRIAFLRYVGDTISDQRVSGYRNALREAGINVETSWVRFYSNIELIYGTAIILAEGTRAMREWLADGWRELGCTALICQNDHVAMGVMKALAEAGIRVPQDVSVVGFDGTETGESCTPTLTSILIPVDEIAEIGIETLVELRDNPEKKPRSLRTIMLSPTLVDRESTASPSVG